MKQLSKFLDAEMEGLAQLQTQMDTSSATYDSLHRRVTQTKSSEKEKMQQKLPKMEEELYQVFYYIMHLEISMHRLKLSFRSILALLPTNFFN